MQKSNLIILIGVPSSGKSFYSNESIFSDFTCLTKQTTVYLSTDRHIESYATQVGKTYDEVFVEYMPTAIKLMQADAVQAINANCDIIWDQTNTTVKVRATKLRMFPNYHKVAVVFPTPEPAELERRLNNRPGKTIPNSVIKTMISRLEIPTEVEGFDEIIII